MDMGKPLGHIPTQRTVDSLGLVRVEETVFLREERAMDYPMVSPENIYTSSIVLVAYMCVHVYENVYT